jgi:uncharacterized tellurite resistance protein B-like protein
VRRRPAVPALVRPAVPVRRVCAADGPLTEAERQAARQIARQLGMTMAQAQDVISLTEQVTATG